MNMTLRLSYFANSFARLKTATAHALSLSLVLGIAACGGGGGGGGGPVTPTPPPPPVVDNPAGAGHLVTADFIATVSADAITAALPASAAGSIKPLYAVDTYKLSYTTSDTAGRLVTASGLVAIPRKSGALASPVMSYQHATIKLDAQAPSNHATADEPAVLFASMGYLVSAADFLGFGATKGQPHPYLLSAPLAASVVDFMSASSRWRQTRSIADNGQLFLTGYSEGAYVTMATLRRMTQTPNATLPVATFVGAGPYSVSRTLMDLTDAARAKNPVLGLLITPGLLKNLGANDRVNVRNLLLATAVGDQTDITWDGTFLDNYLADNTAAIDAQSNVFDWTPQSPIVFFHGKDDTTVSYANTTLAVQAMRQRGAQALVEQIDCTASPASHLGCVPQFLMNDIARLGALAKGL
jgi:fermentation-respiration switch protein FrsA (DUF1100 family)